MRCPLHIALTSRCARSCGAISVKRTLRSRWCEARSSYACLLPALVRHVLMSDSRVLRTGGRVLRRAALGTPQQPPVKERRVLQRCSAKQGAAHVLRSVDGMVDPRPDTASVLPALSCTGVKVESKPIVARRRVADGEGREGRGQHRIDRGLAAPWRSNMRAHTLHDQTYSTARKCASLPGAALWMLLGGRPGEVGYCSPATTRHSEAQ